nr:hypothetical protein [Bryobacterales bacterium]
MDCTVRGLLALAVMLVVSGVSIFGQNAEGGAAGAGAETVASPPASWNVNQSLAAFERSTQLMESTGILVPNLSRAAEPLLET